MKASKMTKRKQTPKQTKRDPDSPEGITYIITPDRSVKLLSPEEEAEARKQADEYFRKQGVLGPELKPHEKLELEEQAKASSSKLETLMKDTHRRCGVPIPFLLEDIFYYTDDTGGPPDGVYDHDDPEYLEKLSSDACGAINDYRKFWYKPGLCYNKEQLKIATEVALDIRAVRPNLQPIRLAENPDCPTDDDFIRLGQWFLDANTVIKAEIAREITEKPAETKRNAIPMRRRVWICLKKIPTWIYYLLASLAALLTILHLLGWLGPIKIFIGQLVG
jgi:hypothetical protein